MPSAMPVPMETGLAVVLGGYVNGYGIVRELHEAGVDRIWVVDQVKSLACYSNRIMGFSVVPATGDALCHALLDLARRHGRLVLFPTNDRHLELLAAIYDEIAGSCFIPFERTGLASALDKSVQYEHCRRLGVPCPRSMELSGRWDADALRGWRFPVLIKPCKRDDLTTSVFRNLLVTSVTELGVREASLDAILQGGTKLLVSEVVPGDDTRIYAYTAYRSPRGEILNEWIGKKLTQYPDQFGIFASASNEAPEEVATLGRKLVEGMDLHGIVEPEFKYDARDGTFKLMEVNLRSMMWHRLGNRSGVRLHDTQWRDALGLAVARQVQERQRRIHLVYLKHEVINLLFRRGYWRYFRHNVFGGDERHFAVFDRHDLRPFLCDLRSFPRTMVAEWRRRS